ncbi:hypothetical protein [Brevibacillus sp. SAFN-007a]|uniref:hypothetical protein n=1 Tax=Brevibacillus sp. SAFN-007a TaxID=3436862 RepID=UPI003F7F3529
MEQLIARFYELKAIQKQVEEELGALRGKLIDTYAEAGSVEEGGFQLSISYQERREYSDDRLYNSLPDPTLWRLMSRADSGKIASLLKLNVIHERILDGTYEQKKVPVLRVQKQ